MKKQTWKKVCLVAVAAILMAAAAETANAREPRHVARRDSIFASGIETGGFFEVRRIPTLGHNIFVNVVLDGVLVRTLPYGRRYAVYLRPGRHVVTVYLTPRPSVSGVWSTQLDVRRGGIYAFSARSESGHVLLTRNQ